MSLKDRAQQFAEGLSLYATYMNSRLGSRAERKWEEWQESTTDRLDEKVMDFYCHVLIKNV